jgi:DNA invertase Pin-like site-specific DNA recombinase
MLLAYRRVSTDHQDLGLESQTSRISAWCQSKDSAIGADYVDEGVSGGIPLAERPQGFRLLSDAQPGDVIVVVKLDRLFRSVADAAMTLATWAKQDVQLVSLTEGFDMTTIYGRAMAQMASVFAELERGMIRERTQAALDQKRKNGEKISRFPPFGWKFVGKRVEVFPREQDALELMRLWRENGDSLATIARRLDENKVKPKRSRRWSKTAVAHILERHDLPPP